MTRIVYDLDPSRDLGRRGHGWRTRLVHAGAASRCRLPTSSPFQRTGVRDPQDGLGPSAPHLVYFAAEDWARAIAWNAGESDG
jgi:hypothetical protein